MKTKTVTRLTLAALAALVAGRVFATENWTKAQQEIAGVFKTLAEAEMTGDVEREMSLLASACTAWDYSQPAPMDRAAYRQTSADFLKQWKVLDMTIPTTVVQIEGAFAVAHGRYSQTVQGAQGDKFTFQGPWTAALIRDGGKWRVFGLGWTEDKPAIDPSVAEKELTKLEQDWPKAYVDRDTATLGRLEADDWVYTDQDGNVTSRAQDIADVTSGAYVATEMKQEDIKVRLYGNTAVVTGRAIEKATYNGKDASGTFRFTDTWVHGPGGWQCVVTHLSKVPAK